MPSRDDGKLITAKVSADGGELAVSEKLPGLLSRILPVGPLGKRNVERALYERIERKIREDRDFTPAEVEFAEHVLGQQAAKFVRLQAVTQQAVALLAARSPPMLPPLALGGEGPADTPRTTPADWVNKYREDVALVDDEVLRTVYARILAGEAQRPQSVSLRTLAVLRYLDRSVATDFALILCAMFAPGVVPRADGVLRRFGITHGRMLALADAGLLSAPDDSWLSVDDNTTLTSIPCHGVALHIKRDEAAHPQRLAIRALTVAGRELANVADVRPDPERLEDLLVWFARHLPGAMLRVAKVPHPGWDGNAAELEWSVWTPRAKPSLEQP